MKKAHLRIALFIVFNFSLIVARSQAVEKINCTDSVLVFTKQYDLNLVQNIYNAFAANTALFWWKDPNNCEDRANAMCKIMRHWGIECGKVWIFNAGYPTTDYATFRNKWSYHVAPYMIVNANTANAAVYIIDPDAFGNYGDQRAGTAEAWARCIITSGKAYYMLTTDMLDQHKNGKPYCTFDSTCWLNRLDRYAITDSTKSATIQGLTGYNAATGQRIRTLHYKTPKRLKAVWSEFQKMYNNRPGFLPNL